MKKGGLACQRAGAVRALGGAWKYLAAAVLLFWLANGPALGQSGRPVFSCESLAAKLASPTITVTLAHTFAAGEFVMPADLKPFFERGGKLMIYDAWNDYNNPRHWINYFSAAQKTLGVSQVAKSLRLFLMPGVNHCWGRAGCDTFDRLAPMRQWVENGKAPERIVASKRADGKATRTRPFCSYPQEAQYTGMGSTDEAENFVCAESKPGGKRYGNAGACGFATLRRE